MRDWVFVADRNRQIVFGDYIISRQGAKNAALIHRVHGFGPVVAE